jgi:DNA-binding transcriptional regulator GbsR (MarR family)
MFINSDISKVKEAQDLFLQEWGRMSSSWGINRTMAQIHALLFITGSPHTMDEICERLHISRGNASMNLRGLMDWGVIRRFRNPGERHDVYLSDIDAVTMVARVIRERKRRELDPTVDALETCLQMLPQDGGAVFRSRVEGLLHVFEMLDIVFAYALRTDEGFRELVQHRKEISALLSGLRPTGK